VNMFLLTRLIAFVFLLVSTSLWAAGPLAIELKSEKITTVVLQGKSEERRDAAKAIKPADIIEYRANYKNTSAKELRGVQAVLPVPSGMTIDLNSAKPLPVQASSDGRLFYPVPLTRQVRGADGQLKTVNVPLSEYRALRWSLGALAAGASRDVVLRARVNAN
jgi:hypothetical protein